MFRTTTTAAFAVAVVAVAWPQANKASIRAIDELRSCRTAYVLQLNRQEADAILSAAESLRKASDDYADWAGKQWKADGEKVKAAVAAWVEGRQPPQDQADAARSLLKTSLDKQGKLRETAESVAEKVLKSLGDKAALVETAQQAATRRLAERRFSGARSPAEAVLIAAEALRLLMPDDYALVRVAEAERLAAAISGGQPEPGLVSNVLDVLDMLVDLPPQRFVADRRRLLADIAQRLGLPPAAAALPQVTHDEFVRWLMTPETYNVLRTLAGKSLPTHTEVPEEYQSYLGKLRVLTLMTDLQMRPGQVRAFVQLCGQISRAVTAAESDRKAVGKQALELVPSVRDALKAGKALEGSVADKVQKVLADADGIDRDLRVAMMAYIRQLRRILSPPQRALVDWVPPGEVLRLLPPQARTANLRRRAGLIQQAIDFLNRLKFQVAKRYMNLKVSLSQDFVAGFVPPDSPDFDRAMDFVLELVAEARMVPPQDWDNGADVEFATRLMRGLGVLRDPVPPPPSEDVLYTWQDLYEIFTTPGAAAVFSRPTQERQQQGVKQ